MLGGILQRHKKRRQRTTDGGKLSGDPFQIRPQRREARVQEHSQGVLGI
jgi:hypothetical protein